MDNFTDSIRLLHQNGKFEELKILLSSNPKQVKDLLDNCFTHLEKFSEVDKQIDTIYLIINSAIYDSISTESNIIRRLFNYYTLNFSILLSLKSWHLINMVLDMLGTNAYIFDDNMTSNEIFVTQSIQLLQVENIEIWSDLDVAIDSFLMIVFHAERLQNYRILLLKFAENNPENVYSSDILELSNE